MNMTTRDKRSTEIFIWPADILSDVSKTVTSIDGNITLLIDSMINAMRDSKSLSISAPQVGALERVIVVDNKKLKSRIISESEPVALINPEITSWFGEISIDEGCSSLPGQFKIMPRASHITVRYQTVDGVLTENDADGITAVMIQHEIDHLDGKLIIDI